MGKDNKKREKFIDNILNDMTLEQKVGQCFTVMWSGIVITPSVIQAITKLHCGGLRIQPFWLSGKRVPYYGFSTAGSEYDYPEGYEPIPEKNFIGGLVGTITPKGYAERLNELQKIATSRPGGIPLHMSIDQEGDFSQNFHYGDTKLFPSAMGFTATGDLDLTYEGHKALALQLSAMGVTNIHSPVLDVNINPRNPEIGVRSYGDDPKVAADYALASMKGLMDGGLITTGKHFPGRGDSELDAHHNTPVLNVDRKRLDEVELYPYKVLIENGLESIMLAHNVYPVLDPAEIATVSRPIVTGLLREELGFEGVITTDAIAMRALMEKYTLPTACAMALQAGADLVLNKTETQYRDQGILETIRFVQEGKITEQELDDKVRRILRMKYDRGLFENNAQVDPDQADKVNSDPKLAKLSRKIAQKSTLIMRNEDDILPLDPGTKVLVVEQHIPDRFLSLNANYHRLTFTEAMYAHSTNILGADVEFYATEEDEEFILSLLDQVDVVVATSYYVRQAKSNPEFLNKVVEKGAKLIIVTNTPYEFSVTKGAKAVVCTFSSTPDSLKNAADVIYGTGKAEGKWPLVNYPMK